MTRTSSAAPPAAAMPAPSFIVYPVPTIADETFLQLIFRERVARSLFFGFGRSRMAVVELSDDTAAQEVVEALAADTHTSKSAAVDADDVLLGSMAAKIDDTMDVAEMSLADMFAPPPHTPAPAAGKKASNDKDNDEERAADALRNGMGFDHLPCLAFRGRPIHVVVSGVRVADFYAGGGAVPAKHEEKEERSNAKKKAKKEARQAKTQTATGEGATAATQPAVVTAQPAVANAYPKNACQKCGSLDHFTRHCDGSGSAATAATTAPATPAAAQDPSAVAEASSSSAPPAVTAPAATAPAATRTSGHFPKECCQKCGSANHFTRHCDGSGATPAVAATPTPAAEKVREAPPTTTTAATKPAPAPVPVVQRTSKDQCKHCGSDAHLSRHCPNK